MPLPKQNPALAGTGFRGNDLAEQQVRREHTQDSEQNQLIARVPKNSREEFWVSLNRFSDGSRKADIRVWQRHADGTWLPTPRNLVIGKDAIPAVIRSLAEAEARLS